MAPKKMATKAFGMVLMPRGDVESLTRDGRRAQQVRGLVRASSQVKAAALLGVTGSDFRRHGAETFNSKDLAALAEHPEGTVLLRGFDPGNTINGSTGYVVWEGAKKKALSPTAGEGKSGREVRQDEDEQGDDRQNGDYEPDGVVGHAVTVPAPAPGQSGSAS